jgi:hypothetical protein
MRERFSRCCRISLNVIGVKIKATCVAEKSASHPRCSMLPLEIIQVGNLQDCHAEHLYLLFALLKKAFIKTKPNYALDLKSLTIKIKI